MKERYDGIFELIGLVIKDFNETFSLIYDKNQNKSDKYVYFLICEALKNIECILECLKKDGLTSSCVLMRQLIEQTAYINVLTTYKSQVIDEYIRFYKAKQKYVYSFGIIDKEIEKILKEYDVVDINTLDIPYFLEQGWLKVLTAKNDNKISDLMKLANLKDLISWRRYFNNFVHLALASSRYLKTEVIELKNNVSYILCVLFDQIIVAYNKLTHYDFCVSGKSFRGEYKTLWNDIRESRKR